MIPCKHCSCSGTYIGWAGEPKYDTTGRYAGGAVLLACKYCEGTGYIDEEKFMTIPRKYVKDEYFKEI